jgi:uncharacterized membrane protein
MVTANGRAEPAADAARRRIVAIDALRGLVMVLMLLDHARSGWNEGGGIDPLDLAKGYPLLFLTRWITHFCAPVFVLLTGLSAGLTRSAKGETAGRAAARLAKRGLWLFCFELIVISPLWGRVIFLNGIMFQVIGAIGVSLLALALLQPLPRIAVGLIGIAIIAFHNLIPDRSFAAPLGNLLWGLLHQSELVAFAPGWGVVVLYPVLPWIGVMALGYGLSGLYAAAERERRLALAALGALFILAFAALRAMKGYGDPRPWQSHASGFVTLLDFIKVEKYPPSLLYILMTVGPALLFLAGFDRLRLATEHPLLVFGRTPLFYYLVHLVMLAIALLLADALVYALGISPAFWSLPFAYPLVWTYAVWLALLAPLYFVCRARDRAGRLRPRRWHAWL